MTWVGAGDSNPLSPFCCPRCHVILTKFYEEQKPSCLPRRHLIHPVQPGYWTLGWWLSQNNLDTASHEPLTRAENEPPANLECHAISAQWPIRGQYPAHWPMRSQRQAGGIQHFLTGSDRRKWVNCQTGLNLHQMDHDHHECGDSIKSESGLRSVWWKCKPSRIWNRFRIKMSPSTRPNVDQWCWAGCYLLKGVSQ